MREISLNNLDPRMAKYVREALEEQAKLDAKALKANAALTMPVQGTIKPATNAKAKAISVPSADIVPDPIALEAIVANRKNPYALCENCPMQHARKFKYVPTQLPKEGSDIDAIVVGEAPGLDEIIDKKPFVGQSGKLMKQSLRKAGINPDNVVFANAVSCRPIDNKLENYKEAIACCAPRLEHELEVNGDPSTPILAVGKYAAQSVIRLTQGKHAPKAVKITERRGQWYRSTGEGLVNKDVLITLHPAFILRVPAMLPDFEHDVKQLTAPLLEHPLHTAPTYTIIKNIDHLRAALDSIKDNSLVSLDIETSNLVWYDRPSKSGERILMIGIAAGTEHAFILPEELLFAGPLVQEITNDFFSRVRLTAHNGKFDCLFLRKYGFDKARVDFDTMLGHYTLREIPPHGLKDIASMKYGVQPYEDELITDYLAGYKKADRDYSLIPRAKLAQYLAWDLACTWQLAVDFEREMLEEGVYEWPFLNILMPASEAFIKVEQAGMKVDIPYLERVGTILDADASKSLTRLRSLSGKPTLNPGSWQQVGVVMFDELGFPEHQSKHYGPRSTGSPAISKMSDYVKNHPFVQELMVFRRIKKIQTSYVRKILDSADQRGYVHPSYKLIGTETGRLSAVDPPIQTLPRDGKDSYGDTIRNAFCAEPGWKLVIADFSQAEMRVWAHFCQDPFLLECYRSGRDLHSEGAIKLFGPNYTKEQRTWVKNFNFAYIYGGNEYSFAGQFNLPIDQAKAFVREYEQMMPIARKWRNDIYEQAVRQGYVQTVFGRKRRFPLITADTLDEIRKAAWNMPIQSTASDITVLALIQLVQEGFNVVVNVHDSIGVHCPESEAESTARRMKEVMLGVGEKWIDSVPWEVTVDIQDRWKEKKEDQKYEDLISESVYEYDYNEDEVEAELVVR